MAVSSAGGHYSGPSGLGYGDSYQNQPPPPPPPPPPTNPNRIARACFHFLNYGYCKRLYCPFDHETSAEIRLERLAGLKAQQTEFPLVPHTHGNRPLAHHTQQAHHNHHNQLCTCRQCYSQGHQGPIQQHTVFNSQGSLHRVSMSQHSECGSVYSQDSAPGSTYLGRQTPIHNHHGEYSEHMPYQQSMSEYNPSPRNFYGGNSQSFRYGQHQSSGGHFLDGQKHRQGNYDNQGYLQRQSGFGLPHHGNGMHQSRFNNITRNQTIPEDLQVVPTGPRLGEAQYKQRYFNDRSSQISTDDSRSITTWQRSIPRPSVDLSRSPKISDESHDLIDLSHGTADEIPQPQLKTMDLFETDIPENAKSLPVITAAESFPTKNNDFHGLIPTQNPTLVNGGEDGADSIEERVDSRDATDSGPGAEIIIGGETLNGHSSATHGNQSASHENTHNEIASQGDAAPTAGNQHPLNISQNQISNPITNLSYSSLGPDLLRLIGGDPEALQNIPIHERTQVFQGLQTLVDVLKASIIPQNPAASESSPETPPNTKNNTSAVNTPQSGLRNQPEKSQPNLNSVTIKTEEALMGSSSAAAKTEVAEVEKGSKLGDSSYPSSVFSSPPSSPRFTTCAPRPSLFRPDPLPFPTELSFEDFKRKNICVSNICYNRMYVADTISTTVVGSYRTRSVEKELPERRPSPKEKLPSRAHSPKERVPAEEDEDQEDDILGPRPKSRWTQNLGNSRPPSPDPNVPSNEPQPLPRITRQHVFDKSYCWNCWSQKHKSHECPDPLRNTQEREQLRVQKRAVSKSWARELESQGLTLTLIPMPGVREEEAVKMQTPVPLRYPKKKAPRNFSPAMSVSEENPGSPSDKKDWWNNAPPAPSVSDTEIAKWANPTGSSTTPQEGTYTEHPWNDISMESGAETTISCESTEAYIDGDCYNSSFDNRSNNESEYESTTSLDSNDLENMQQESQGKEGGLPDGDVISSDSESSSTGVDVDEDDEKGVDNKELSSNGKPKIRIREPRPEELQEPRVIFVGSENCTPRRHRGYTTSDGSSRGKHHRLRLARAWANRGINKLPTEILTQIIEYVGLQRLDDDPQNEDTVHERAKAECTRALDLKPLRFVSIKFYMIVQRIIYTRINITASSVLDKLARQLAMRERLASMVLDITVDINQLRKYENWRDYGNPRAIAKSREASQKMTIGQGYLMRDIVSIFENCKSLHRFAFHCTGAAQAFAKLDGHYPSIRKLSICDLLEVGKCGEMFWRNIQRCPNLEEVTLLRPEENRDLDMRSIQINPAGKSWAMNTFHNIEYLKFTNASEISDKVLLHILPNLPKLSRIFLFECKLVTSSGIARVVTEIQDRLTEFVYCDFVDCNGNTSPEEEKSKKSVHLCHALARCSNLRDLSLSAYRCCSDLFTMSNWPYLRNLKVDMMFYTGCHNEEDDTQLRTALLEKIVEGRFPSLPKSNIVFQTSLIYKRNKKFTQEELERASGYR